MKMFLKTLLSFVVAVLATGPTAALEKQANGVVIPIGGVYLKLQVRAANIIRVAASPQRAFFAQPSFTVVMPIRQSAVPWRLVRGPGRVTVVTASLQARVDLATGAVSFWDAKGKAILAERLGGRVVQPAVVQGQGTFHVRQAWEPQDGESLYGLGQQQLGLMDIKGYDLDLWQHNTNVVVPFLVSSRGYGILWDNSSYSRFGDLRPLSALPPGQLIDADGRPGGLTRTEFAGAGYSQRVTQSVDSHMAFGTVGTSAPLATGQGDVRVVWEGAVAAGQTGMYTFQAYSNGGIKFWVNGRLVMDHWRQNWLPSDDVAHVLLTAGQPCRVRLEWTRDQGANTMQMAWKTPSANLATSLWSEVGGGVDYDFVYGPSLDKVVAGYRRLTGRASMLPRWAFGLWQSRQRYEMQQQGLDVVDGFRSRAIPFDNIVQDWFYWPANAWGSHQFDPARFPDPGGWVKAIHARHAHLMISVWGKFYPGTANFEAMHSRGFLYEPNLTEGLRDWVNYPFTFYDAFNPAARLLFWDQVNRGLFSKGVDAWWMDATEPDMLALPDREGMRTHMMPTAAGTASKVLNGYALRNSEGVYDGQRRTAPDQRVFILTRSGFAGQQRYATATWSGDITSTWTAMRKQITAGLGFSISGNPYWTMDTGGFSVPARFASRNGSAADGDEWRELNARWFEFAAFVPLLRVHGEAPFREMWQFGGDGSPTYNTELKFDRLRYRLLPYIYSLAGGVTQDGGTIMRPLVMDFPLDAKAREAGDEYLFGPAFLVSPVTTYGARSRSVYLPTGGWFDFWTGAVLAGGRTVMAAAPFDSLPLFVRAGSIIPFGPEQQYVGEKKADPITLYVYAGADGEFSLYEDDGVSYGYEHGAFSRIPIYWNEATKTLTISRRVGTFPGMLSNRTFNVVVADDKDPVPFSLTPVVIHPVHYRGAAVSLRLP